VSRAQHGSLTEDDPTSPGMPRRGERNRDERKQEEELLIADKKKRA
jgi:hypothetical protein